MHNKICDHSCWENLQASLQTSRKNRLATNLSTGELVQKPYTRPVDPTGASVVWYFFTSSPMDSFSWLFLSSWTSKFDERNQAVERGTINHA